MRGPRCPGLFAYLAAKFPGFGWRNGLWLRDLTRRSGGMSALLGEAWAAWQALDEADRETFVSKMRETYARRRRQNGGARRRPISFDEVVLTEADFAAEPTELRL
jgi:hypothetical protein